MPAELLEYYRGKNLAADQYPQESGHLIPENQNVETLARIYAMIGNVDRNVGRLMQKLDELNLTENTIVIFMCDNGPNTQRYVMGMRGHKASVYEGGIRSPFSFAGPPKLLQA